MADIPAAPAAITMPAIRPRPTAPPPPHADPARPLAQPARQGSGTARLLAGAARHLSRWMGLPETPAGAPGAALLERHARLANTAISPQARANHARVHDRVSERLARQCSGLPQVPGWFSALLQLSHEHATLPLRRAPAGPWSKRPLSGDEVDAIADQALAFAQRLLAAENGAQITEITRSNEYQGTHFQSTGDTLRALV